MSGIGGDAEGRAGPRMIEVPVLSQAIRDLNVPLSLVVEAGNWVFVSGIPPIDCRTGKLVSGDIAFQCDVAMTAMKVCLHAAGASMDKVVSVKVHAANAGHYATINEAYRRHFGPHLPARTFIPVGSWPGMFDIEIECIAFKGRMRGDE